MLRYTLSLVLLLAGCSKAGSDLPSVIAGTPNASFSPKPPIYGVVTASNFFNVAQRTSGLSLQNDGAAMTAFTGAINNMSYIGGKDVSGVLLQANAEFAAQVAASIVAADAGKQMSDPTRVTHINYANGFVSAEGANTFTLAVRESLLNDLARMVNARWTTAERQALLDTMTALRATFPTPTPATATAPTSIAAKKLLVQSMITIVLVGNSYFGG